MLREESFPPDCEESLRIEITWMERPETHELLTNRNMGIL